MEYLSDTWLPTENERKIVPYFNAVREKGPTFTNVNLIYYEEKGNMH